MPRTRVHASPAERTRAWRLANADPKVRIGAEAAAKLDRIASRDGVSRKDVAERAIMALPD